MLSEVEPGSTSPACSRREHRKGHSGPRPLPKHRATRLVRGFVHGRPQPEGRHPGLQRGGQLQLGLAGCRTPSGITFARGFRRYIYTGHGRRFRLRRFWGCLPPCPPTQEHDRPACWRASTVRGRSREGQPFSRSSLVQITCAVPRSGRRTARRPVAKWRLLFLAVHNDRRVGPDDERIGHVPNRKSSGSDKSSPARNTTPPYVLEDPPKSAPPRQ